MARQAGQAGWVDGWWVVVVVDGGGGWLGGDGGGWLGKAIWFRRLLLLVLVPERVLISIPVR